MNCSVGDFAIVAVAAESNMLKTQNGKIVRILRFVGKVKGWRGLDRWAVDAELLGTNGSTTYTCRDCNLTPLKGSVQEVIAQLVAMKLSS